MNEECAGINICQRHRYRTMSAMELLGDITVVLKA